MLFFAMSLLQFFTDGPFLSFQGLRITRWVIKTYRIQFSCSWGIPVSLVTSAEMHASESKWRFCLIIHFEHLWRFSLGGGKMFSIFWHSKQSSSVLNTAFGAPLPTPSFAGTQSFHVSRCVWKFLEGFTLNQPSDWKLSEHAVRCAKETFKLAGAVFTHTDTRSHIQPARVRVSQSPVNWSVCLRG